MRPKKHGLGLAPHSRGQIRDCLNDVVRGAINDTPQ
jgi:hypothetical protein